jgi:hypothetical protein
VRQPFRQLAEKLLRRLLVSTPLDKNIADVALPIDSPPRIVPPVVDREEYFVQVPLVAWPGTPAPELIGIGLRELAAPVVRNYSARPLRYAAVTRAASAM